MRQRKRDSCLKVDLQIVSAPINTTISHSSDCSNQSEYKKTNTEVNNISNSNDALC